MAKAPADMCFTDREKTRTPSPEPGRAGLKAVCIWIMRVVDGAATFLGTALVSWATAAPVTDSRAAASAISFIKLRRTTDHPSPGSPKFPKTAFAASHLMMLARGVIGNKRKARLQGCQATADQDALHVAGALVDLADADVSPDLLHQIVGNVPVTAMDLNCGRAHFLGHLRSI